MSEMYLGDTVYARIDEFGSIVLTTDNGIATTNTIVLELEVWRALRDWIITLEREAKERREASAAKEEKKDGS